MINIRNYISKDFVFGVIGGSILATIITSIIDGKVIEESNKQLELSNEKLKKSIENFEEHTKLYDELHKVTEDLVKLQEGSNAKIEELENELKKYDNEDFKEWMRLKETFKVNKGTYGEWLLERDKQKKRKQEEEIVKKAIEEKDWTTVYNKAEGWYNKYPVQMGRYEVFRYLNKDGYVTDEEVNEARNYYGSLWNYVGD